VNEVHASVRIRSIGPCLPAPGVGVYLTREDVPVNYSVKFIDGKVELPPPLAEALGIRDGSSLHVTVADGQATLSRDRHAELEQHLRELQPPGISAVDDLIAERRAEAILSKDEFRAWSIQRWKQIEAARAGDRR
jgi:antitoxin component of MazEF toxin-antitoxin module